MIAMKSNATRVFTSQKFNVNKYGCDKIVNAWDICDDKKAEQIWNQRKRIYIN